MPKNVIAVWGQARQGKSDTIKKCVQEIQKQFPNGSFNVLIGGADIKAIITIGKIIIGVESQGDPGSRQEQSLKEFATKYNCDIIICASRTSGKTVEAVDDMHNIYGYDIIWATNYISYEKNQGVLNQYSAEQTVELLIAIMNGKI